MFPKASLKLAFFRERLKNRMRLFYLKNVKLLGYVFDPMITCLVVVFGGVVKLISIPAKQDKNLLAIDESSII